MTTWKPYLEPSILPLIPSQFPDRGSDRYRDGPALFVAFLTYYYQWMQDPSRMGATTAYSRGFLDLRDVDRTSSEFLVHIKQKYLNDLRFQTESDTRLLTKHAKDLYRAKGSPRALDLFFRLLYDEVVSLYYPKDDLMQASSGSWIKANYLELSLSDSNRGLEAKAISGLSSGAVGFVDSVIRLVVAGKLTDVAFISAVDGDFTTGELITPNDSSIPVTDCPTVVGSLTNVTVGASGSGSGYSVGDVLPINSPFGVLGLARVASTTTQLGLVSADLVSGGYGYTNASTLYVSDAVVVLSNLVNSNVQMRQFFHSWETVTQPQATFFYRAATGTFSAGQQVFAWTAGAQTGSAAVLSVQATNSTAGFLQLAPLTGNVQSNALYTVGNAVSANLDVVDGGYVDLTATAWIVGSGNLQLFVVSSNGNFVPGETVVQSNPLFPTDGAVLGSGTVSSASHTFVAVGNVQGVLYAGRTLRGLSSGAVGNVTSVSLTLGLKTTNSSFTTANGNVLTSDAGTSGTLSYKSSGISATFGIAPTLTNTETYLENVDYLAPHLGANLAGPYGFSGNATANVTTLLSTYMTFQNVTVGSLSNVFSVSTETQAASSPFLVVVDGTLSTQNDRDLTLYFTGASRAFQVGEVVTQSATGARGLVESLSANGGSMFVGNLRMDPTKSFSPTVNTGTLIVGGESGASANVTGVWVDRNVPSVGRNANLVANTISANGAVTSLQVVDSGFGYPDGTPVWLGTGNSPGPNSAFGVVGLGTSGHRAGYYADTNGFLSDVKKLFDGSFYQNFSYQITSSHQLADYVDLLKRVVHVAGMAVFGEYRRVGTGSLPVSTSGSVMRQTITFYPVAQAAGSGSAQAGVATKASASAAGQATVAALGTAVWLVPGSSAGSGHATAIGLFAVPASASGVGSAQANSRAIVVSVGNSTGSADVEGFPPFSNGQFIAVGQAPGAANALAVGLSNALSTGFSTGSSVVSGQNPGSWGLITQASGTVIGSGATANLGSYATSGANLVVISVFGKDVGAGVPTDTAGNVYKLAKYQASTDAEVHVWYCVNPTTSANVTISANAQGYDSYSVSAWSGPSTTVLDVVSAATILGNGSTLTAQAGPITPGQNGELVLAYYGVMDPSDTGSPQFRVDQGFTIMGSVDVVPGGLYGGVAAYLSQGVANTVNPTMTRSNAMTSGMHEAAVVVAFAPRTTGFSTGAGHAQANGSSTANSTGSASGAGSAQGS